MIVKEKEKKHLTKDIKKIKNESTDSQCLLKFSDLCPEAIERIKESCK